MTAQFSKPLRPSDRFPEGGPYSLRVSQGFYGDFGKTLLDRVLVVLSLPIVVPLIGLCALLIALDGGSPFYRQKRVGRNGREFMILKLRTMIVDADRVLEDYLQSNPQALREWEHKQKLCHDPRVTRVGRFLRKTSLDELPQLWNVLKGEMSLVGPRPMMPEQKALYHGQYYYHLRPGITGMWQVSERNESGFIDRVSFDTEYYRKLSFKLDVSLLVSTIGVVLRGTGY